MNSRDWSAWQANALSYLENEPKTLPRDPGIRPQLDVLQLIRALHQAGVQWILTGSAVFSVLGVRIVPGDLDVVPELSPDNLERLAQVLDVLQAVPLYEPQWQFSLSIEEVQRWRSHPAVEGNLDHAFITDHGVLDIVPRMAGTFDALNVGARWVQFLGEEILVSDPQPIAERMRASKRAKDQERVRLIHRVESAWRDVP
jgi:hypothetical protein